MQPHLTLPPACRRFLPAAVAVLCALIGAGRLSADEALTGEQIYRKQCARCHGAAGEGKKAYPHPLVGERSVAQLAELIARTMPEDDPGSCVGADADKVAAWIYEQFYSKAAQERNKPPRLELSRLTVRQHQNAIADLIASFRTASRRDERQGLRGEYFSSRQMRDGKAVLDRIDPEVRFDFKDASPDPKIKPEEFSVRWQGSVLATETGEHEFVSRTTNGARLWVNDNRRPLIDASVRSGASNEQRGSLRLLGGRTYALRLEVFKSKEAKEKTAAITLEWRPPHGVVGPIPLRQLSPSRSPETLILEAAFPPDDRSLGWERATTVSKAWDQAATDTALETANYVLDHLTELSGVRADASDRGPRLRAFCRRFAERAFRRPLTEEQQRFFVDRPFDAAGADPEKAVQRVVLLVLLSPRFLYREVGGGPEAYNVASRLAFGLWDAPPDQELLDAAAAGKLSDREQVARQAERMLADPRAHVKVREFFFQWLKLERTADLAKDPARFPGFDPAIVADLRTALELFLEDVVWSNDSDFRRLLLADELLLNGRLARFYGVDLPAEADFQKIQLNPEQRAGVLTHPYVLAAFAYTGSTSPIHRGVFVSRGILGVTLRPPPEAFAPLAEDLHPRLTTRERVNLQTKPATCQSCHGIINPLGFALEQFDAVGRFRDKDNGQPIDATGSYLTRTGRTVKFTGARDLATFLAESEEVHNAFVEQLFQHLAKQPLRGYGLGQQAELRQSFVKQDLSVRKLMIDVVTVYALTNRDAKPTPR